MEVETSAPPTDNSEEAILTRAAATAEEPAQPEEVEKPVEGEPSAEPEPEVEAAEPDLEARPELPENAFHKYAQVKVVDEKGEQVPLFKFMPELRGIIGRHEAFSELGSISDLRGLVEKFPTPEDVERLTADAEAHAALNEAFRGDPKQFLAKLQETDEGAFRKFAEQLPELYFEADSRGYQNWVTRAAEDVLSGIRREAEARGIAELVEAIDTIGTQAFGRRLDARTASAAPDARDTRIAELERKLAEQKKGEASEAFTAFQQDVHEEHTEYAVGKIEEAIKKAVPQATPAQLKRMVQESWGKLDATLKAQPQTRQRVQDALKAARTGKASENDKKALIDFLHKRADLSIPVTVKAVISEWTRDVLGARKQQIEKQKQTAEATKEAKGATGSKPATKPVTENKPASPFQRKRSEEEIFASLS